MSIGEETLAVRAFRISASRPTVPVSMPLNPS